MRQPLDTMATPGTPPLITVFGGSGFIGRYVCEALLKSGARLRVAERNPRRAWFLQPLGSVGQVTAIAADLGRPASIERAVDGAGAVINLVGIFKGDLDRIHVEGARLAATAAARAGASAFVQVSAIGADPDSASNYGRTKGLGEQAVRAAFPTATIIRPSVVFGPEDDFTNRFASMARLPLLPVIAPNTRFQPVFVRDVAKAIVAALADPAAFGGKTFDLGGPRVYAFRDIIAWILREIRSPKAMIEVPDFAARMMGRAGDFVPLVPMTSGQFEMLQSDNVAKGTGFAAFGIDPVPLEAVAPAYLERYRTAGRFHRDPETTA